MKTLFAACMLFTYAGAFSQTPPLAQKYLRLPFGSVRPAGWIKTQMQKDVAGFVGNLDRLVPELIHDSIYGSARLHKDTKSKDLGNNKAGDAAGDEQYKWWNSETQSNWWDGYIRNVLLLDDKAGIEKVKRYIRYILSTQDADGYLGIYDPELRYKFTTENGELWSKTTLYRGLLAYFEYTNDSLVWSALARAVSNVMMNYPINNSSPFFSGNGFNGGVSHGLTFTDVLDRMGQLSGDKRYDEYAAFLYSDYSVTHQSEKDAQLGNILNHKYKNQSHGVHTYEFMRPLMVATYTTGDTTMQRALGIYQSRIRETTTLAGGPIGDEWIAERKADATLTGFEYCSIHELVDDYSVFFQKSGQASAAEQMENIFYNAAQGARNPDHSCIAYLKTDNSFEMLGTRNGEVERDRKQTRYKYSPVHQEVAVCCSPNAGRITPYFVQSMWLSEGPSTLVASVLGPNQLKTLVNNTPIEIEEITEYPYSNRFTFHINVAKPLAFTLKIRKPAWAQTLQTTERYKLADGFIVINKTFQPGESIKLNFSADVQVLTEASGDKYFAYGALIFAYPIKATEQKGRKYAEGFEDFYYKPVNFTRYEFIPNNGAKYINGGITLTLQDQKMKKMSLIKLVPYGKTILRQAAF